MPDDRQHLAAQLEALLTHAWDSAQQEIDAGEDPDAPLSDEAAALLAAAGDLGPEAEAPAEQPPGEGGK